MTSQPAQPNRTVPNRTKCEPSKAHQIIRLDGATHEGCGIWPAPPEESGSNNVRLAQFGLPNRRTDRQPASHNA